ncbi:MAG: hypothetical protein V3T14_01325, partial [Myxococcota bacterium]
MRGAILLAALLGLAAPLAHASSLVGVGLNRDELVRVEDLSDPQTARPFPFGASPTLRGLDDFESAQALRVTTVGDRIFVVDTDTDRLYELDPFTGEMELLISLQVSNPPPWSDPDADFDLDQVPNGVDACPALGKLCQGGPNDLTGCVADSDCSRFCSGSQLECATNTDCPEGEICTGSPCLLLGHADADDDGVGDFCDNCPNVPNPRIDEFERTYYLTTTGSQPDADRDGLGDACDCDFTATGTVCASGDLERMIDALGGGVGDADDCLDSEGSFGPCAPFDLTGDGAVIDQADLTKLIGQLGTNPGPCPSCPFRCSGPACDTGPLGLGIKALTWDPIGGPVWPTATEIVDRERLFFAVSSPGAGRGLFSAHLEGPRRFILFPYAATERATRSLAFDPYPKTAEESVHQVLYGATALGFYAVDIKSIDALVRGGSLALPVRQPVDQITAQPRRLGGPLDNNPVVRDSNDLCGSFEDFTLESESCDPNDLQEAFFWTNDRCRTRSFCTCTGNDCAQRFLNLNTCYNAKRICSGYCSPYRAEVGTGCPPDEEVSGFIFDGDACVPLEGCCEGIDCELVFEDREACEFAYLEPRDANLNIYPTAPCPNYYHRPSCAPDAQPTECLEGAGRDGFFFNGYRCNELFDFCCEGPDCEDAFIAYNNPLPPIIAADPNSTFEEKEQRARGFAQLGCWSRHVRCAEFCEVLSEVSPTTNPNDCAPDEVFVDGWIWQLQNLLVGIFGDCKNVTGCCKGPDCEYATDTYFSCVRNFDLCLQLEEEPAIQEMFFENAGGIRGRLVGLDENGNMICINPGIEGGDPNSPLISAALVGFPEKELRAVTLLANFDVTGDNRIDVDDVCTVKDAITNGETFCM